MSKLDELKQEINHLRHRLGNYIEENEDDDKIFSLNIEIDKLVVEYHRLSNEN